jgi:hypothetical protein
MQPHDEEALRTDAYLDRIIATRGQSLMDVPTEVRPDAAVADAASLLRRALVRFHPSFRFEERLAARLAAVAEQDRGADRTGRGALVALPVNREVQAADRSGQPSDPSAPAGPSVRSGTGTAPSSGGDGRSRLLLSGAIASGVSIAGAALYAWRRSRPPAGAFSRAARAVHGSRSAAGRTRRERLS